MATSCQQTRHRVSNFLWEYCLLCSFLSRVSILTRDIDIANLSVCPSVRYVPVLYENSLTYCHSFFSPYGSPVILVLPASNTFTKFRRGLSNGAISNDLERTLTLFSRSHYSLTLNISQTATDTARVTKEGE